MAKLSPLLTPLNVSIRFLKFPLISLSVRKGMGDRALAGSASLLSPGH